MKDIMSLQPPPKKDSEPERETFKQTASLEQASGFDEITNTEEIPF